MKTEMVGLSWKHKEKLRERQLISSRQRAVGVLLIVLGVLVFAVGLFGYLAGDLQLSSLSWLSDQVYAAREAAQSAGTAVTGAFDLYGEDSGVRRLTRERGDATLSIPLRGQVNSLNASVALGIAAYEVVKSES